MKVMVQAAEPPEPDKTRNYDCINEFDLLTLTAVIARSLALRRMCQNVWTKTRMGFIVATRAGGRGSPTAAITAATASSTGTCSQSRTTVQPASVRAASAARSRSCS